MKALLVIDLLKDFLNPDGALYCGDHIREIIPFIKEKVEEAHSESALVVWICDSHEKDDSEFKMFPPHCVEGSEGAETIDELEVRPDDVMVKKSRYSGFCKTDLERILAEKGVDEVEVVGVCTSICVMDTVGGLKNRDYEVTVFKDGVGDLDEEDHRWALKRMEKTYGAKVL